jgi:hypothetical protein
MDSKKAKRELFLIMMKQENFALVARKTRPASSHLILGMTLVPQTVLYLCFLQHKTTAAINNLYATTTFKITK